MVCCSKDEVHFVEESNLWKAVERIHHCTEFNFDILSQYFMFFKGYLQLIQKEIHFCKKVIKNYNDIHAIEKQLSSVRELAFTEIGTSLKSGFASMKRSLLMLKLNHQQNLQSKIPDSDPNFIPICTILGKKINFLISSVYEFDNFVKVIETKRLNLMKYFHRICVKLSTDFNISINHGSHKIKLIKRQ